MYDYKLIITDNILTTKFEHVSKTELKGVNKSTGEEIGTITLLDGTFSASNPDVHMQYEHWTRRPERKVGKLVDVEGKSLGELMDMYEELLIGAWILKHPEEQITVGMTNRCTEMIDWLRTTDFYTAPASTQYHESFVGGLLLHSIKVYNESLWMTRLPKFKNVSVASIAFVALTHDWCKINTYESYMRNSKNEETGQWEKVPAFKRNLKGLTLGHGTTSMYFVSKYFNLTDDEAAAIRWHQGRWNVCDAEVNEFQRCNETYPLVHLIQFADQLSIVSY